MIRNTMLRTFVNLIFTKMNLRHRIMIIIIAINTTIIIIKWIPINETSIQWVENRIFVLKQGQ